MRNRLPRSLVRVLAIVCVLVGAACQAKADVRIESKPDGSGRVVVTATFDDEARAQIGDDLATALRLDDLRSAGWTVTAPRQAKGLTTVVASKPFAAAARLGSLMAELGGATGPFRDWKLTTSNSFTESTSTLTGSVDLTGTLDQFSDAEVAAALDGLATGRTPDELAAALKEHPDALQLSVTAALPGEVEQATGLREPTGGGDPTWNARLGSGTATRVAVRVESRSTDRGPALLMVIGAALVVGAAVLFAAGRNGGGARPPSGGLRSDVSVVVRQLRLTTWSIGIGLAAGACSAWFLRSLRWVTEQRIAHPALLWLLPIGGALFATTQVRWGGRTVEGNRLTMSQIRHLDDGVPLRMTAFAWIGTLVTHVLGGSAGREGTALQMAAGVTDGVAGRMGWSDDDRRLLLIASLAAGFGSVFSVPYAGVLFCVEVAPVPWRDRAAALPAAITAAFVGDATVGWLGIEHDRYGAVTGVTARAVGAVLLAAPLFGLAGRAFVWAAERVQHELAHRVSIVALRPAIGGLVVIGATLLVGSRDYNGLSTPLLDQAFALSAVGLGVWAVKGAFTAATIGSGFVGGEVTPLFVMGATLGAALGHAAGGPVMVLAAVGMMAVFGSAANAPIACIVMGVELFGWGAVVPLALGCLVARLCSGQRSLYAHEEEPVPEDASLL